MEISKEWILERKNPLMNRFYHIDQYFLEWFESQGETDSDKILEKLEEDENARIYLRAWLLTQLMDRSQNLEWSIEAARLACPIFEKQYQENSLCRLVIEDTVKLSQLNKLDSTDCYMLKRTALQLLDFINDGEPHWFAGRSQGYCAGVSANRAASIASISNSIPFKESLYTSYLAYEAITFAHSALVEPCLNQAENDKAFKPLLDIGVKIYHNKVKESNLL
jgi:hypothetical protein